MRAGVWAGRGAPRALAQRELELSLQHRGSVKPAAHPEGFGTGEVQRCPAQPCRCSPPRCAEHKLPFTPGSAVPSPALLPPRPPPGCYFKHASLGDHLSTAEFAEKIKACEPRGRFSPPRAALGREPAVVAGTSRGLAWRSERGVQPSLKVHGLGMLSRGHLPCRGR